MQQTFLFLNACAAKGRRISYFLSFFFFYNINDLFYDIIGLLALDIFLKILLPNDLLYMLVYMIKTKQTTSPFVIHS